MLRLVFPQPPSNDPSERRPYETWRHGQAIEIRPLKVQIIEIERAIIEWTINICAGDREEAALRLGIGRVTLYRKLGHK